MTNDIPQLSIRERIRDLNTKAYYLLVALSFVYRANSESWLLKLALTLVATVAVFPVQDYVKSSFWLEVLRTLKVLALTGALVFALVWIWTATTPASRSF